MDPEPVGSVSLGRIRIVKWEIGPGTDPGSEIKTTKDIRILYYIIFKNYIYKTFFVC